MKKILMYAVIILLAVSLLTACGGKNDTAESDSDGNSSSAKTPVQTPLDTERIEYNELLFDGEGVKITLVGYEHKFGGHCYYVTYENNTETRMGAEISLASVNRCMIDLSDTLLATLIPGEKLENVEYWISDSELLARGINEINDFEVNFRLVEREKLGFLFNTGLITVPTANPGFAQTFDSDGIVVAEQGGIKITAIRVDYNAGITQNNPGVWVFIENNSEFDVDVVAYNSIAEDSAGGRINGDLHSPVMSGKVAYDHILYYGPDFKKENMERIETLKLSFYADTFKGTESQRLMNQDQAVNRTIVMLDTNGKAVKGESW